MPSVSRRPAVSGNFAKERRGTASFHDDLTIEIILVPSVGADPISTWGSWIEEDLLVQIPTAHFRFYDHGQPNESEGLEALGKRFLGLLQQSHTLELRPPTIFLCHGTGGLVVKTALVNAQKDQIYLGVVQSCIGIAFFSVPQHGSDFLSDPDFYRTVNQIPNSRWQHDNRHRKQNNPLLYPFSPSQKLIGDLKAISDLEFLSESFSSLLETSLKDSKIWSLYETVSGGFRWSSNGTKLDDQLNCVVLAESATYGLSEMGTNIMLLCDHWGTPSFDTMHPKDEKRDSLHASTSKSDFVSEVQGCVFGELWPFGDITKKFKAQSHCFYEEYPYHISNDMSFAELLEGEMKEFLYPDDTISLPKTDEPKFVPMASKNTKMPRSVLKKRTPSHTQDSLTSHRGHQNVKTPQMPEEPILMPGTQRRDSQGSTRKAVMLQTGEGVVNPKDSYHGTRSSSVVSESGSFGRRNSSPIHEKSPAAVNVSPHKLAFSIARPEVRIVKEATTSQVVKSGSSKPRCRWIHVPCTHTGWAEEIIRGFAGATNQEGPCEEMLQDKFWLKRQNSVTHSLPHARYMHSMCEFFGRIPDKQVPTNATDSDGNSKRGSSPHPTKRGKYPGVRAIMYIPYLHWEPFRQFRRRERVIHNCIKLEATPDQQRVEEESRTFATHEGTKRRKAEGALLANFKLFSKLKQNLSESPDLKLIWQCLSEDKQLHCRRSLDQYMYTTLPDTSVRDRDQILYKSRLLDSGRSISIFKEEEEEDIQNPGWENDESDDEDGTPGNVLVVDQLWMFVMDDDTVVTFFPPKEVDIKTGGRPMMYSSALEPEAPPGITPLLSSKGDIQTAVLKDLESKAEYITDKWDMAALVVKHAVTVLFDRFETKEPHVMTHFGRYIERLTESQARSWSRLKIGRGRRLRGSTKDVQQIFQDIRDLRELRDVEDELGIIKKILDKQQTHVGKMLKEYGERIHLTEGKGVWYLDEAVNMIDRQHEQVTRMLDNIQVTIKGYDDLIALQQNQIALYEAIDAGEQSRAVTIFTVFTVFFLPLSFFTSLYGMNIQEWTGEDTNISMNFMLSTTLPISFLVIAIAFLFANDTRARSALVEGYQITLEFFIIIFETLLHFLHLPGVTRRTDRLWKRFKHTYFTPLKVSLKKHRTLRIREKKEKREKSRLEVKNLGLEEKYPKRGREHRSLRSAELVDGGIRKRWSWGRGEDGRVEVGDVFRGGAFKPHAKVGDV